MRNTLNNYIKLLIKNDVLNNTIKNIVINFDTNRDSVCGYLNHYTSAKKIKNVVYDVKFDVLNKDIDILNLPVKNIKLLFDDDLDNLKYERILKIKLGNECEILSPSSDYIKNKIWRGATKYNCNYPYSDDDFCIHNKELYKAKGFTHGDFKKDMWIKCNPIKCRMQFEVYDLPKYYTDTDLYRYSILKPELYYSLSINGNTVMGCDAYNRGIEIYHTLDKFTKAVTNLFKEKNETLNIRENLMENGQFYIIENSKIIDKKRLSKM